VETFAEEKRQSLSERSRRCYAHGYPCGYLSLDGSHMLGDQPQHYPKKEVKG